MFVFRHARRGFECAKRNLKPHGGRRFVADVSGKLRAFAMLCHRSDELRGGAHVGVQGACVLIRDATRKLDRRVSSDARYKVLLRLERT
jgi:hypothetical protein